MATKYRGISNLIIRRFCQSSTPSKPTEAPAAAVTKKINVEVPGLSQAVLFEPTEAVGPGVDPLKTGDYKVPEYFCYNQLSYYEAEIEMNKFRLPQPSNRS